MSEETPQNPPQDITFTGPIVKSLLAHELAALLGETTSGPVVLVNKIIKRLGADKAQELSRAAIDLQAQGGMLTLKGDQKRTTGGIFFFLVKELIGPAEWNKLAYYKPVKKTAQNAAPQNTPETTTPRNAPFRGTPQPKAAPQQAPAVHPLTAEELASLYQEAPSWPEGTATTIKLTLVGRPGKAALSGGQANPNNFQFAAFTFTTNRPATLPKGLPIPGAAVKYLVLLGSKQWRKAEADLAQDENNRLLIEAYPSINAKVVQGVVATTSSALPNLAKAKEGKELVKPEIGIATTTKLTLVGRHGEVKIFGNVVAFTMTAAKVPSLPAGLPTRQPGTKYLIFVQGKQWSSVKEALEKSEEDKLILEGYPSFEPGFPGVILSVTNTSSMGLQKAKREQQINKDVDTPVSVQVT